MAMQGHYYRRLLLGPSAFALVAGILGLAISGRFIASDNSDHLSAGRLGLYLSLILLCYGILSLVALLVSAKRTEQRLLLRSLLRWAVVAVLMFIPTAFLFGPVHGFHHHIVFGILGYMLWDGERPIPGSLQIVKGYEVVIDPLRTALTCVIWTGVLVWCINLVRPVSRSLPD